MLDTRCRWATRWPACYTAVQPGTGHVLAMSVNRRYGCSDPDCESVNLNVAPAAGRRVDVQGLHRRGRALGGLRLALHADHRPQPYTSQVFKKNGGTRGAPYVVSNDNAGYAVDATT